MSEYINFDKQDIGQIALDEALSCLEKVHENEHFWKYAIIAIHNALQCYLSIALRKGSGIDTWKKQHAKKWIAAYEAKEEFPEVQLDFFMELYDKLFTSKSSQERDLIKWLNDTRNEFIHFVSDSFSVHQPSLLSAFGQALSDIQESKNLSRSIFFYNDLQEEKFLETCEKLKSLQEKLNK